MDEKKDAIKLSDKVNKLKENVKERTTDERSVFYEKPMDKRFIYEQIEKAKREARVEGLRFVLDNMYSVQNISKIKEEVSSQYITGQIKCMAEIKEIGVITSNTDCPAREIDGNIAQWHMDKQIELLDWLYDDFIYLDREEFTDMLNKKIKELKGE